MIYNFIVSPTKNVTRPRKESYPQKIVSRKERESNQEYNLIFLQFLSDQRNDFITSNNHGEANHYPDNIPPYTLPFRPDE